MRTGERRTIVIKLLTIEREYGCGGSVIVGRGSQHFLRDRTDTLRVFLYAPRSDKIRRLLETGVSESEVEQLVDTVDQDRSAFVEKYFHIQWPNRPIYHAMFNTALGDEIVIGEILSLKAAMER
jgi:cytidylate kinase